MIKIHNAEDFVKTAVDQVEELCHTNHYDNTLYQDYITSTILMPKAIKIVLELIDVVDLENVADAIMLITMTEGKHVIFQRAMISVMAIFPSYEEALEGKRYIHLVERDRAVGLRVINFKGEAEKLSARSYHNHPVKLIMVSYRDLNQLSKKLEDLKETSEGFDDELID